VQLGRRVVASGRHKFGNLGLVLGHGGSLKVNSLCQQVVGVVKTTGVRGLLGPPHKIGAVGVLWGKGGVIVLLALIVPRDLRHSGRNLFRLDLLLGEDTEAATLAFLDRVLEEMPFSIQRIQTDRGTEFFAENVQRRLMAEAIRFRPVRPRSPHLNGKVERAQRTVLEEFWAVTDTKAADLDEQLALWVHHYNWHRSHEALHGLPPIDRVCALADKTPLWEAVSAAYEPDKERIQVRPYAVEMALRELK
jgi:hypothetical protein